MFGNKNYCYTCRHKMNANETRVCLKLGHRIFSKDEMKEIKKRVKRGDRIRLEDM